MGLVLRQEDIEAGHLPQLGKPLAFVLSGSWWAQDRGAANVVYRLKRAAGENDLGELHKSIKAAEAARAAVRGAAA